MAKPSRPTVWPAHAPPPVQDESGRWLSPVKRRPICPTHNPQPADIMWRAKGDGVGSWTCAICHRATSQRYTLAKRAARRAAGAEALEGPRPTITPAHPFDWTRLRLEKEWGVPIEQWTRAQHRLHTRAMYHHLGWGDAALEGPVVANGQRLDKPRAVHPKQGMMWRAG